MPGNSGSLTEGWCRTTCFFLCEAIYIYVLHTILCRYYIHDMIFCQLICHPMYVSSYALCVYIYIYIHSQQQVGENGNIPSWKDTYKSSQ